MQQCKTCGSTLSPAASICGMCGQIVSDTAEEITLISNADPSINASWSPTLVSGNTPTLISEASHLARGDEALGELEHTDRLNLSGYGVDQSARVPDESRDAEEDEEERKRRALLGVPLAELLVSGTRPVGYVPMIQGTPSLSNVTVIQGTIPTPEAMPAGNLVSPSAPAGSVASPVGPGYDAHSAPSHATPTGPHHEPGHHHRPGHHHEPGHHHRPGHPRESGRGHGREHHRLPHRHGCAITVLVTIVAGMIIFSLIISGWFLPGHPRLTLTGDGHVTWGDDLHVHGSGFPGGISITLEVDDGSLFSTVSQHDGVQSNTAAFADMLFWQRQADVSNGTLTVHRDGTFDATVHIGENWSLGRHVIRAIEKDRSVHVELAFFIDAQPSSAKLSVNTTTIDFGKVIAGSKPARSLTLRNTGFQKLVWTAGTGDASWLKPEENSGSIGAGDPAQLLQIIADTSSLSPGIHQALLRIKSNGGNAQVDVSLLVVSATPPTTSKPGHLTVSTDTLDFGQVGAGMVASQSINLGNDGQGALNWSASTDGANWWGIDNPGGTIQPGGFSPLTVTVKTSGLSAGTHLGTLTINSDGGTLTVQIQVTVTASPGPARLTVNPTSIDFGSVQQGNAVQQSLSIENKGGRTLNWSASTDGAGWWGIDITTGSVQPGGSQLLTVSAKTGGLKPGSYSGTLTISSNGGSASVPPSLTVTAAPQSPCITVDQKSISLSVKQGQTTGQNVVFTNCGQVAGDVSIVANAANGSGWLSITELNGGSIGGSYAPGTGQTISIYLDATKLSPGKYTGTVAATITTSAGLSQSTTVSVTFTVL